jgi:hypothetical protein
MRREWRRATPKVAQRPDSAALPTGISLGVKVTVQAQLADGNV